MRLHATAPWNGMPAPRIAFPFDLVVGARILSSTATRLTGSYRTPSCSPARSRPDDESGLIIPIFSKQLIFETDQGPLRCRMRHLRKLHLPRFSRGRVPCR